MQPPPENATTDTFELDREAWNLPRPVKTASAFPGFVLRADRG
jgi:hypothetical protein